MWVVDFSPSLQRCCNSITYTTPDSSSYIVIAKDQLVTVLALCSTMNFSSHSLSLHYWATQSQNPGLGKESNVYLQLPNITTWYLLKKDKDNGTLIFFVLSKAGRNRELASSLKKWKKFLGDKHLCLNHPWCQSEGNAWRHSWCVLEWDTVKDRTGRQQGRK